MTEMQMVLVALLSPLLFLATAVFSWFHPGRKPKGLILASRFAVRIGLLSAALSAFFVYQHGLLESPSIDYKGLGLSIRLDALSSLLFVMISLISFIVMRFSLSYLDGDTRQGVFIGRLAATMAAVQLLVLAGNLGLLLLAWIFTSFSLHRLLVFYPNRVRAVIAARKKFVAARLSDLFFLAAVYLLYSYFGTGRLEAIFQSLPELASATFPWQLELAAICLAFAAIFKSALFPTHGWLVEMMETPTPVSALLHAGLLNAGPFLIARLALVMGESSYAPVILVAFGGLTALFGSLSYLTQPSVKTALGYSSISHMGFSLMLCGLGLYAAAMLHLVAHSFYKAHAFLSSGSAVEQLKASQLPLQKKEHHPFRLLLSLAFAMVLFAGLAYLWGIDLVEERALLTISAIIVMGLALFVATALNFKNTWQSLLQVGGLAAAVGTAFFALEAGMSRLLLGQIPAISEPGLLLSVLISLLLVCFGLVVLVQLIAPARPLTPFWQKLAIHFRNGLYANVAYDRLVGALYIKSTNTGVTNRSKQA